MVRCRRPGARMTLPGWLSQRSTCASASAVASGWCRSTSSTGAQLEGDLLVFEPFGQAKRLGDVDAGSQRHRPRRGAVGSGARRASRPARSVRSTASLNLVPSSAASRFSRSARSPSSVSVVRKSASMRHGVAPHDACRETPRAVGFTAEIAAPCHGRTGCRPSDRVRAEHRSSSGARVQRTWTAPSTEAGASRDPRSAPEGHQHHCSAGCRGRRRGVGEPCRSGRACDDADLQPGDRGEAAVGSAEPRGARAREAARSGHLPGVRNMTTADSSMRGRARMRVKQACSFGSGCGPRGDLTASHARGRRFKSCAAHQPRCGLGHQAGPVVIPPSARVRS